jgi:hypothetical protein
MSLRYVKNSSPQQTAAVCRNLLEAMDRAGVDRLDRATLEAIVAQCDVALPGGSR